MNLMEGIIEVRQARIVKVQLQTQIQAEV